MDLFCAYCTKPIGKTVVSDVLSGDYFCSFECVEAWRDEKSEADGDGGGSHTVSSWGRHGCTGFYPVVRG